ncbi:sugar phosphate isomerase/epimerase family protein [Streptomyces sp. MP131-18]|uniref:sugar phosphate isomerase/epimerase family protein n=1 Tax=Streptomyces sp. MP131-18 TaxID=1857892 RepID=UPI0009C83820|nr:sugar phosphate isomerase/epimerase family protein [Streptomyces sp. MP131-18]ONK10492.1 hydroxypyruvate isomerase [Streptomyces sp. MP131-18]
MPLRELTVAAPEFVGTEPLVDSLDRLTVLRDLGVSALELWSPWQVTEDDAAEVGAALQAAGLRVACVSSPSYLHGEETGSGRRLVESSIRIARELGADRVNTYFGHGGDGDDRHAARTYAGLVAPLLDRAAEAGVRVVLENEFDGFGHDPEHYDISRRAESLRYLVEVVDHPAFGLTFDAANFVCAGEEAAKAAALLAPHVGYVHVKDVIRVAPGHDGAAAGWNTYTDGDHTYQTVELGTGEVPWDAVLDRLEAAGYDGPFTLEPHCQPGLLADQLAVSVAYLTNQ